MNIFVIGDSISIHYGPALEASLKGLGIGYDRKTGLDAAREDMDVARGANGGDSARVLAYLRQCATRGPAITADTLLVNCGLHDIKTDPATGRRQVPIEAYRDNLEAIVMLATGALARRMVWIRTTPATSASTTRAAPSSTVSPPIAMPTTGPRTPSWPPAACR